VLQRPAGVCAPDGKFTAHTAKRCSNSSRGSQSCPGRQLQWNVLDARRFYSIVSNVVVSKGELLSW
jgi:hypothetical protein